MHLPVNGSPDGAGFRGFPPETNNIDEIKNQFKRFNIRLMTMSSRLGSIQEWERGDVRR